VSDTLFQSLRTVRKQRAQKRAMPLGCGLVIGASVSIGLWGLIIWAVAKALD
jgi:hypothetical protein